MELHIKAEFSTPTNLYLFFHLFNHIYYWLLRLIWFEISQIWVTVSVIGCCFYFFLHLFCCCCYYFYGCCCFYGTHSILVLSISQRKKKNWSLAAYYYDTFLLSHWNIHCFFLCRKFTRGCPYYHLEPTIDACWSYFDTEYRTGKQAAIQVILFTLNVMTHMLLMQSGAQLCPQFGIDILLNGSYLSPMHIYLNYLDFTACSSRENNCLTSDQLLQQWKNCSILSYAAFTCICSNFTVSDLCTLGLKDFESYLFYRLNTRHRKHNASLYYLSGQNFKAVSAIAATYSHFLYFTQWHTHLLILCRKLTTASLLYFLPTGIHCCYCQINTDNGTSKYFLQSGTHCYCCRTNIVNRTSKHNDIQRIMFNVKGSIQMSLPSFGSRFRLSTGICILLNGPDFFPRLLLLHHYILMDYSFYIYYCSSPSQSMQKQRRNCQILLYRRTMQHITLISSLGCIYNSSYLITFDLCFWEIQNLVIFWGNCNNFIFYTALLWLLSYIVVCKLFQYTACNIWTT